MTNPQTTSTSARSMATRRLAMAAVALGLFGAPVMFSQTASSTTKPAAKPATAAMPPPGARAFPTAQAAASALIQAAANFDEPALAVASLAQLGRAVVVSPTNPSRATLQAGPERWPLPVPLVKIAGKWYFDAKAGRDEILFRRVGANELDAIEVCRGFVEAQKEY